MRDAKAEQKQGVVARVSWVSSASAGRRVGANRELYGIWGVMVGFELVLWNGQEVCIAVDCDHISD